MTTSILQMITNAQNGRGERHVIHCGRMAGWIKMALGMDVGLVPSDIVLDGDPAPPPPKRGGQPPKFLVHVYCGQMAESTLC